MAVESERDRQNKRLGKKGESQAVRYLKKSGYSILERGYKNPFGEVDIIASKEGIVAFIEVKTRLSENYGAPSEAVNRNRRGNVSVMLDLQGHIISSSYVYIHTL